MPVYVVPCVTRKGRALPAGTALGREVSHCLRFQRMSLCLIQAWPLYIHGAEHFISIYTSEYSLPKFLWIYTYIFHNYFCTVHCFVSSFFHLKADHSIFLCHEICLPSMTFCGCIGAMVWLHRNWCRQWPIV